MVRVFGWPLWALLGQSRVRKDAEILVLRYEVMMLRRQVARSKPRLGRSRAVLAALAWLLSRYVRRWGRDGAGRGVGGHG